MDGQEQSEKKPEEDQTMKKIDQEQRGKKAEEDQVGSSGIPQSTTDSPLIPRPNVSTEKLKHTLSNNFLTIVSKLNAILNWFSSLLCLFIDQVKNKLCLMESTSSRWPLWLRLKEEFLATLAGYCRAVKSAISEKNEENHQNKKQDFMPFPPSSLFFSQQRADNG